MRKEDILTLIIGTIREILPDVQNHRFRESDSLEDLGANSMDRAEIVMTVLERMNLDIPLIETFGPHNLGELARHLSTKCA